MRNRHTDLCPYNYMQANLGIYNQEKVCLLKQSLESGYKQLLDIAHDESKDLQSCLNSIWRVSFDLLQRIECDKDVTEKGLWADERNALASLLKQIENR